jgi:hypothetical protein
LKVAHLVDEQPLTDRELVLFIADRLGKMVRESQGRASGWRKWVRPSYGASRSVRGWPLEFGREVAEREFRELLDRDDRVSLAKVLKGEGAKEE